MRDVQENRMINIIKSSRQVEKSETSDRKKSSFSRMMFDVSRLERIEQVVAGQILGKT